jgi:hypothetical protein
VYDFAIHERRCLCLLMPQCSFPIRAMQMLFQSFLSFGCKCFKYSLRFIRSSPCYRSFSPRQYSCSCMTPSIRSSSRLTSLQLIHIPPAHRHVALVFIHAPREALDILRTRPGLLLLLSGTSISSLRIVEPVIRRLCVRVLCRLLVLVLCWLCRRAATEPATDSMANRGSDCNTTIRQNPSVSNFWIGGCSRWQPTLLYWPFARTVRNSAA